MTHAEPPLQSLERPDGATLAYRRLAGQSPTVVFLHGFMSDMTGTKATALEAFCAARGQSSLRFDYFGHGASSGEFADGTIGRWRDDAVAVLDALTEGPLVLVGSSLGGWIMLLAALERRQRIKAMVGIAAAPDATEDLMWPRLSGEQRDAVLNEGSVRLPSAYDGAGYAFTRRLFDEGRRHLVLRTPIALDCPVRLLQGMLDEDVPWQTSLTLAERLAGTDVQVTILKDGDHRLSRPADLALLCRTVAAVID